MPPTKVTLADLPHDTPMPLLERRRIIGTHAMISHVTLHKGCKVPLHHHENEQFSHILTGKLRFTFTEPSTSPNAPVPLMSVSSPTSVLPEFLDLNPGETLHLPPNCPHAAEALEHTTVLDIFSPPSQTTGIDRK